MRRRDMSAGELAEKFPLAKSTLSGHFNVLRGAIDATLGNRGQVLVFFVN